GILFTALVSSSAIPGLYGFHFGGHDPAEFSIEGSDERRFVTVTQTFSILVTVPDGGNSALLLGTSILILFSFSSPAAAWRRRRKTGECSFPALYNLRKISMTILSFASSRLPVGSSAKMSFG